MSDRLPHINEERLIAAHPIAVSPAALRTSAALAVEIQQQEERTMSDKIATLANEITAHCRELQTLVVSAARVSPPPRDLRPVLVQLADVERELVAHGERWHKAPRTPGNAYSCAEEQGEWSTLCRRRESLVADVVRYALAMTTPLEPANEQSGWAVASSARTP